MESLRVYVVLEDDRGCGPSVVGVFYSLEAAEEFSKTSGHYFLDSTDGEEVL